MHAERYEVSAAVWDRVQRAQRVVAVGTTTARALESAALTGQLAGHTELFIHRGFHFQVVERLHRRAVATTSWPRAVSTRAVAAPMPLPAPVTRTRIRRGHPASRRPGVR